MWAPLVKVVCAYLLGSVMGSLVLGRVCGGADIRTQGSRNAGATNAFRTRGAKFALAVMLIDLGKGVVAVTVLPFLPLPGAGAVIAPTTVALACGVAVVLGHVYPVFFGFRGGKGAATLTGVYLCVLPAAMPALLIIWAGVLVLSGFVGLATMLAAVSAIAIVALFYSQGLFSPLGLFTVAMAALVIFTHRANIARMLRGQENRFKKAMLLRRR